MTVKINADTTNGAIITSDTSGEIELQAGGTKIATVKSTGLEMASGKDLTLSSTALDASASGIYLGGTASANLLDDYEEGDWTPEIGGTTANPTSITHSNDAKYIKIGNMCHLWGFISIQALSGGSGQLEIENLPFACATWTTGTSINGSGVVPYWSGMPSGSYYISCWAFRGSTKARFNRSTTAQTTMQNLNITDLDSTCDFRFMLTYPTE